MVRILVLVDDTRLNQTICTYLNDNGFHVTVCHSAKAAYDAMYNHLFELVISDIMMLEVDEFEFAETIRRINKTIPILFMTAKDDFSSKQRGFHLGIDYYMVKPVKLAELVLRVSALLRRTNLETDPMISIGNMNMDADTMTAKINDSEISFTDREFHILYKLLSYPDRTFSRAQLMEEFWDHDTDISLRAVDVYVTKLRDKCRECTGFQISTVRGLGYKAVLNDIFK